MRICKLLLLATSLVVVGAPSVALASSPTDHPAASFAELEAAGGLKNGQRVRVTFLDGAFDSLERAEGRVQGLTQGAILLQVDGLPVRIEEERVLRIERRGDPVGNGAAMGAAAGGIFGVLAGSSCGDDFLCPGAALGLVTAPAGALLGTLLDALNTATEIVYERPPASAMAGMLPAVVPVRVRVALAEARAARFRLDIMGGTVPDPSSSVAGSMRRAGLSSSVSGFLFGDVSYPRWSSVGLQPAAKISYRPAGDLGMGLLVIGGSMGSVVGRGYDGRTLEVSPRLHGVGLLAEVDASSRLTLGAGPAWYRLDMTAVDAATGGGESHDRLGLAVSVAMRLLGDSRRGLGVVAQYRHTGSADFGPFRALGSSTGAPADVHLDTSLDHVFLGLSVNLGLGARP